VKLYHPGTRGEGRRSKREAVVEKFGAKYRPSSDYFSEGFGAKCGEPRVFRVRRMVLDANDDASSPEREKGRERERGEGRGKRARANDDDAETARLQEPGKKCVSGQ